MTSKTVLLVEDDFVQIELVKNLFEMFFPTVKLHITSTVPEAINILKNVPVHLVLLDLMLDGGTNGLDVVWYAQAQQPRTPVIVITGDSSEETEYLVNSYGVDGFVTKPITLAPLASLIKSTLIIY